MKRIGLIICLNILTSGLFAQVEVSLYDTIPNSKPSLNNEKSEISGGILRVSQVSVPGLTMYQPKIGSGKRAAVIICPGGGYGILAAGHEGSKVAKIFASWGITAFVLKYRLPDESIMIDPSIGPLQDAQRAVQLVRQQAIQWNIDPQRIGIMGFSAGGHLAATASTRFDEPVITNHGNISLRPDFSILIYPVISFTDSLAHKGSRNNLIGKNPGTGEIKRFSNELQVNARTPPAFLVHAKDDKTVKVENSISYYQALQKNNIKAELWLYAEGGHGFGMNNTTAPESWMDRLKLWLVNNHYL